MKAHGEHPYAATIGIDWSNAKHDICLRVQGRDQLEYSQIPHTVEAVNEWARELRSRFGGQSVAVALELAKGPLVYLLEQHPQLVIFPINPATLAKYRQTFTPSHAKDDPTDAFLALDLLTRHHEHLSPLRPERPAMRALKQLINTRIMLRGDITRVTNRLTSASKNYYPQVLDWFADKDTRLFCDFLLRWPTSAQAKKARRSTLERFLRAHNVRRANVIKNRIDAINSLTVMSTDPGVVEPNTLLVQILAEQLTVLLDSRARCEGKISSLCEQCPDHHLFASFPGAGPIYSARLTSAFGEQRERLPSATHAQRHFGIAPVIERSGNKSWTHWRYRCDAKLRQTLVEWAALSIPHSFWANAYYQQQRHKGSTHQAALRALAFKWTRILYRCWHDGVEYDESTYLAALKQRGSPLLKYIANSA